MSLSASPRPVGEIAGIRNGLSPPRLLPPRRGPQGSWSRGTLPARLPRDEIRAPATLVDAVLYAPADVGSIPTVSIFASYSTPRPARRGFELGRLLAFWHRHVMDGIGRRRSAPVLGLSAGRTLRDPVRAG